MGLRWWNYVDEDGKSQWIFESRKVRLKNSSIHIFYKKLRISVSIENF